MKLYEELKKILPLVNKPGRYAGGEFGSVIKENPRLTFAISFPDLYEIGMSNIAVKLIYNLVNSLENVSCERVFAPDMDLEARLRERNLPLFSLETFKPLNDFDILGFSIGYELSITNVLNIMDVGQIPYLREKRGEEHPIVIAGGPSMTNPAPFSRFVDFVLIGEGEPFFLELFPRLAEMKSRGASKNELMDVIRSHPSIWEPGNTEKSVKRSVWDCFSKSSINTALPVSNIKVVQDHGNVEIMRGCPNGCRFCHAGILYRPYRMRQAAIIDREVARQAFECGYREITLSSLSTGDYQDLDKLIYHLNHRYKDYGVSFALPSLRINSLSLDLLEEVSRVRKSGLTFAIETPREDWQRGLNKEVSTERIIELLKTAVSRGWRVAKFYFMIGLPHYQEDESEAIVAFIQNIRKQVRIDLNVNISTFIPKPHTPFQWAPQLTEEQSDERIRYIRRSIKDRWVKIGNHSPFASTLEGLIARGDERVGEIVEQAFLKGARLDAWEEHLNRGLWEETIKAYDPDILAETNGPKAKDQPLPWSSIDLGVTGDFLKEELARAENFELTPECASKCKSFCGVCDKKNHCIDNGNVEELSENPGKEMKKIDTGSFDKLLISYSKTGKAAFLSHLNTMALMERSLIRAGYFARFTEGFNPKPIIEFASPLPLGIDSEAEIFTCQLYNYDESFVEKMNRALPEGYRINRVKVLAPYVKGTKKISLASLYYGGDYRIDSANHELLEKVFQALPEEEAENFKGALVSYKKEGNCLHLRMKDINKKGKNLLGLMKILGGEEALWQEFLITRTALLAGKKEPGDYFDHIH